MTSTDPKLDAKARRVMEDALNRFDARQRSAARYQWLTDHGLLAVVVLCTFVAGFVVGAIWQLQSGY
jgi:hypothetical protein